jgi:hypothetical protein
VAQIQHELDERTDGGIVTASAASSRQEPLVDDEAGSNTDAESGSPTADERLRQAILGKWDDEYRGKRHLTVREDGSGTMIVEPDGIGRRLFAAELRFELEWRLEDGRVTMKMTSGEPKSKVQMILKLYGREADYGILSLTDDQMLLLDPDGKTRYDWRRPAGTGDTAK